MACNKSGGDKIAVPKSPVPRRRRRRAVAKSQLCQEEGKEAV